MTLFYVLQLRRLTLNTGELIVVQDDLLHPVLGGNKLRKLDGLLPEVKGTGCTDLVGLLQSSHLVGNFVYTRLTPTHFVWLKLTCGGLQSAHTAAVAAACAEQGIKAHLLVRGERPAVPTGFHLLARMFAQVTYIPRSEYANRPAMLKKYAEQIKDSTADIHVSLAALIWWITWTILEQILVAFDSVQLQALTSDLPTPSHRSVCWLLTYICCSYMFYQKVPLSQLHCWGASALYTGWPSIMCWAPIPSLLLWTVGPAQQQQVKG